MNYKIGAHLSIAGGYQNALTKIKDIGGNCLQIFSSSPRMWIDPDLTDDQIKNYKLIFEKSSLSSIYFHASYLINLADNARVGELSKATLIKELNLASQLGVRGSVVHLGSFKENDTKKIINHELTDEKYQTLVQNIVHILTVTPENTLLIIENAGNRKIGQSLDEIGYILQRATSKLPKTHSDRLKVCLDTCHLHAAGYSLSTKDNFDNFFKKFEKIIGLEKLELFHMNDSKGTFNSGLDRHENIGEGKVGIDVFKHLLNNPTTSTKPFILEVPGFEKQGPDSKNITTVKNLLASST